MTELSKQLPLLLKSLCEGLPFGLKVTKRYKHEVRTLTTVDVESCHIHYLEQDTERPFGYSILDPFRAYIVVKPFLRPMSSMTEAERSQYNSTRYSESVYDDDGYYVEEKYYDTLETFDFLNANHFDHRGLIEMNLANEAPIDMYKTRSVEELSSVVYTEV